MRPNWKALQALMGYIFFLNITIFSEPLIYFKSFYNQKMKQGHNYFFHYLLTKEGFIPMAECLNLHKGWAEAKRRWVWDNLGVWNLSGKQQPHATGMNRNNKGHLLHREVSSYGEIRG